MEFGETPVPGGVSDLTRTIITDTHANKHMFRFHAMNSCNGWVLRDHHVKTCLIQWND